MKHTKKITLILGCLLFSLKLSAGNILGHDINPPHFNFAKQFSNPFAGHTDLISLLILGTFIALFVAYIIIDITFHEQFIELFQIFKSHLKFNNQILRENSIRKKAEQAYTAISLISIPWIISITSYKFFNKHNLLTQFLTLIAIVFAFYVFVYFSLKLFGKILKIEELTFKTFKLFKLLLIFLSPVFLILGFIMFYTKSYLSKFAVFISLLFFLFAYIYKTIKQLQTFNDYKFSIFFFILYLWGIEILPWILILTSIKY